MKALSDILKTRGIPIQKKKPLKPLNLVKELTDFYYALRNWHNLPKEIYKKDPRMNYSRNMADSKKVLQFWDLDEAKHELTVLASESKLYDFDWRISTSIKRGIRKNIK